MPGKLSRDMHDFLCLLDNYQVEYLICGGHAVAFHGYARLTQDIDIFTRPSKENARRLFKALKDFGFENAGLPEEAFAEEKAVATLGVQPNQIDILTSIGGKVAEDIDWQGVEGELDGHPVRFVIFDDLLAAKRAAGRLKDLADLEELEAIRAMSEENRNGIRNVES